MRGRIELAALALALFMPAWAQNVSSSVRGTLADPAGAFVPGASCTLANQATGAALIVVSGGDGSFVFPNVQAGVYDLKAAAAGFKTLESAGIVVTASEVRVLGEFRLELGEMREAVSVHAETAAVQLASAERSGIITGGQLNDIAVKGRDFFGLLLTVPGVVDTFEQGRETMTPGANRGMHINGGRDTQKNVTVDGVTNLDTGSNTTLHFQPNMDAISEIKILTTNYQAEFGRNSGGTISVITKGGSLNFHGAAYDFYRHESLNANSFFNNRTGTPKSPYRYRISGYALGGPVLIPGKFNRDRNKLFFFWSQEYTGMKRDYGTRFVNMPTERERQGDFSRSFDVNGALIAINDPLTGRPFPGNLVPQNRISRLGQAILNFYPLPNYDEADPKLKYSRNYRSSYSGPYPKRQDMIRIDANPWPTLQAYYRYIQDTDEEKRASGMGTLPNYLVSTVLFGKPGKGHVVHLTKTFSPTLVNEFIWGKGYNRVYWDIADKQAVDRSKMGNPPRWFASTTDSTVAYVPDVSFGATPVNSANSSLGAVPFANANDIYSLVENVSKVWRSHTLKAGIYLERTGKLQNATTNSRGEFAFARDANNPFESNDGYSNALLGNFRYYTQAANPRRDIDCWFWNVEWFVQDNWKMTRRLTLDLGLRFYHLPPIEDVDRTLSTWDPKFYDPARAPALYVPAIDPATRKRVAKDPLTGTLAPAPLIAMFVPGSGDSANGIVTGGKNGYPPGLYTLPWLELGPRLGFAYDLAGNGRTALRGGFGMFRDRANGNPIFNTAGNPPQSYTPTLFYGNLDSYASAGGAIGPSNLLTLLGKCKLPATMNFSFGVQHRIWSTLIDAAYVGGLSRHLLTRHNVNAIPMFSRFDANNQDPTTPGRPLQDEFFRPIKGYGNIVLQEFTATSNYNSLQVSVNRRFTRGLQFGLAYTWSKVLGVTSDDNSGVSSYFPARQWNYARLLYDRSHVLVFNYMYELPKPGRRLGLRPLGWVADNWLLTGATAFLSGAPYTPGFTTTDAAEITGSGEGPRITLVGDPYLPKSERTFYRNFNVAVFARTPVRSFGNSGLGILTFPGVNNWDVAISKRVPLGSEARFLQFRAEFFNVFNHTQFSAIDIAMRFDARGVNQNANAGAYNAARPPRIIQFSGRVSF